MHHTIYYPIQPVFISKAIMLLDSSLVYHLKTKTKSAHPTTIYDVFFFVSGLATHQLLSLSPTSNVVWGVDHCQQFDRHGGHFCSANVVDAVWGFWKRWCSPSKVELILSNLYIYDIYTYIYVLNYIYICFDFVFEIYPLFYIISHVFSNMM